MKTANIIAINETYGFTVSDREYSVYKLVTIDPTKAPAYKPEESAEPPQPYDDWRTIGRYYPITPDGLRAMLVYVAQRSVNDTFTGGGVSEYVAAIQA